MGLLRDSSSSSKPFVSEALFRTTDERLGHHDAVRHVHDCTVGVRPFPATLTGSLLRVTSEEGVGCATQSGW